MKKIFGGRTGLVLLLLVVLLLAGLPVAVWLDLTNLTETNLNRQASDLNSIISSVRSYYASNVVGRKRRRDGNRPRDRLVIVRHLGGHSRRGKNALELGKVI